MTRILYIICYCSIPLYLFISHKKHKKSDYPRIWWVVSVSFSETERGQEHPGLSVLGTSKPLWIYLETATCLGLRRVGEVKGRSGEGRGSEKEGKYIGDWGLLLLCLSLASLPLCGTSIPCSLFLFSFLPSLYSLPFVPFPSFPSLLSLFFPSFHISSLPFLFSRFISLLLLSIFFPSIPFHSIPLPSFPFSPYFPSPLTSLLPPPFPSVSYPSLLFTHQLQSRLLWYQGLLFCRLTCFPHIAIQL